MAAKPEHHPDYNKLSARLKRAWGAARKRDVPVIGYIPHIINPFNDKYRDPPDVLSTAFGWVAFSVGFLGNAVVGLNIPEHLDRTTTYTPSVDEAINFSPELGQGGYLAVTANDGRTGYALFNYEGDTRLYSYREGDTDTLLTLIDNADDAWRTARDIYQDYGALSEMVTDLDADVDENVQNWELVSLPELTLYAENGEGDIVRFSQAPQDYIESESISLQAQYRNMQDVWADAARHFATDGADIPADEFTARAGNMTTETYQVDNPKHQQEMRVGHIISGVGVILFACGGVRPVLRRRREMKKSL